MTTLARIWHELVLRHGEAWMQINRRDRRSRKWGAIIECPCGKRWLSRAPWDLTHGWDPKR